MILMDFSYFFLLFSGFLGGVWGAVLGISAISATFSCSFQAFGRGLGCCLGNFCGFSYFFLLFSGFLAEFGVLFCEFLRFQLLFSGFFGGFGALFGEFLRFQLHKARLLCYQPMAIVHYDNLKIQYFLNKKTKNMNFQKK